jgi:hypothetical protein
MPAVDVAGEFETIRRLFAPLAHPEWGRGLADDVAVVPSRAGHDLVLTKDAIVEGVHFLPTDPLDTVARKLMRVNLSDLAAKGAEPFRLSAGLPLVAPLRLARADDLRGRAARGSERRSASPCWAGIRSPRPGRPAFLHDAAGVDARRGGRWEDAGARPGDLVFVTGAIGDGWLGLEAARGEIDAPALADRYRLPRPRTDLIDVLRREARAAADVSDGPAGRRRTSGHRQRLRRRGLDRAAAGVSGRRGLAGAPAGRTGGADGAGDRRGRLRDCRRLRAGRAAAAGLHPGWRVQAGGRGSIPPSRARPYRSIGSAGATVNPAFTTTGQGRPMRRRHLLAVLPLAFAAGAAQASGGGGGEGGKESGGQYVDLSPVALPIVLNGRLINYVFVQVRINLTPSADAPKIREKEPWFRDALVRAGHRTPFTKATDYTVGRRGANEGGSDARGRRHRSGAQPAFRGAGFADSQAAQPPAAASGGGPLNSPDRTGGCLRRPVLAKTGVFFARGRRQAASIQSKSGDPTVGQRPRGNLRRYNKGLLEPWTFSFWRTSPVWPPSYTA